MSAARDIADAVARRSYGKLVAYLAARTRDLAAAEDALSEAFASALTDWPLRGVPSNPEAWLLTAARRKAIDALRRRRSREAAAPHLLLLAEELNAVPETQIPDQRLALLFACAHPAIEPGIRAPLVLQTVLGFSAQTIASAFLTSPSAMAKRLVRAKEKIRAAGIALAVPGREDLPARLDTVLEAIYAAFAEGWDEDPAQRGLAGEAIYLARLVADMLPQEPEALGLLALMLHAEARRAARRDAAGEFVPLAEQDVARWDAASIAEAEALLHRAAALGVLGRYQLEAALQSAHVFRRRTGRANWGEIVQFYDALHALTASPVVAINRALALAETQGLAAALAALGAVAGDPRLAAYQPYWAARAELLTRAAAHEAAREAYDRAIGLEADPAVRRYLLRRRAALPE